MGLGRQSEIRLSRPAVLLTMGPSAGFHFWQYIPYLEFFLLIIDGEVGCPHMINTSILNYNPFCLVLMSCRQLD